MKAKEKTNGVLYKYKQIKVKLFVGCFMDSLAGLRFGEVGVSDYSYFRCMLHKRLQKSKLYMLVCRHIPNDFSPRPFCRLVFTVH